MFCSFSYGNILKQLCGAGSVLPAFVDTHGRRSARYDMIRHDPEQHRHKSKLCTTHVTRLLASTQKHVSFAEKMPNSGCWWHFSAFSRSCMLTLLTEVNNDENICCHFKGQFQSIHPSVTASITHLLSHILAALQVVVTVWKDLRLHNGHDAVLGGGQRKQCHDRQ